MYIYPLARIHNTSLVIDYFGLDKHECECLKYLFIYFLHLRLYTLDYVPLLF
jgi:hypothetical protein